MEFRQGSDLSVAKAYVVSSEIPVALELSFPAIASIPQKTSTASSVSMTTLADNEPTYVWTRMLGSSTDDDCFSVAADNGSAYVYGKYASADLFLRKYSSAGTVEWSSQWTSAGSNFNSPNGADTAADGSIYVTGGARGAIDEQPYSSSSDLFLSKYSSSGTRLWTRMASSPVSGSPDYAKAVATTASGDVYVAGTHGYPLYENGNIYLDSDFCLYKYDSSGNLLGRTWPWGSAGYDQVYGAASGADNSVYMAGILNGDNYSSNYLGNGDLYVSKHDSSGVFLWEHLLGSTNEESFYSGMGNGIEVAPDGSIYATCCTASTGINQAYLAKLSPTDGSVLWSRIWGAGSASTLASGIDIDAAGNVYVCGTTYGSFDGQTYSGSQGQIFISKYDADGNRLWSRFKGSAAGDFGTDIAIDGGNIYAGGSVSGSVDGWPYSGNNDMVLIRWTNAVASADVEVLSISTTTNSAVIEAGTDLEKSDFLITTLPENRQDAVSIFPTSFQNAGVYTVEAYTASSTASCEVVVVDLNDPLNLTSLQDLLLLPVVDGSPTMSSRISPELFSRLVNLAKAYNIPMDFNYSPLWNDWEMAREVAQTAWAQGQILARQGYGTADRDACVADPVNLVSGVFYETEADLVLPAPIPLIIGRNYASGGTALSEFGYGWTLNHHYYLTANRPVGMLAAGQNLPDTAEIRFVTDCGTALVFSRNSSMDANRLKVGGAASASEDNPSLNNDNQFSGAAGLLKNIDLVYTPSTRTFRLLTADGEVRDYGWKEYGTPNTIDYRKRLCLEQRVYPDGNKIKYAYTNALLSRIEAVNSNETIVFNGVDFAYTNALVSSITADDGRAVQYVYDAYGDLKSVVRVDNSEVIYGYEHISTNGIPAEYSTHRIARVEHPGSRILLNDYYVAGEIVGGSALPFDDYRVGRVKAQYRTTSTPTPELNSTFSYNMNAQTLAGSVTVYDALQNKAVYQVDTNGLITAIETYVKNRDANGQLIMSNGDFTYRLYSVVRKYWDDSKLIYRTVEDHSGDVWLHWGAGYDDRGNMLSETISGNLTGEFTSPLVITTSGALISGESATRTYTYTYDPVSNPMDRLNLITSITTSKGAVKRNIWDEGSGRLMASLTCRADADGNPENNPVYARTCYTYNTNGVLTTTVSDDGTSADPQNLSGVTTRRITHIVPGEIAPLYSLPATVIEAFDEGGGVQTNSSLVYSYNTHGFSERIDVYAADQSLLYFTSNRVDAVGRVLVARDTTGSIVTYEYDQNGNVLEMNGPLPGDADRTAFGYDYANRLVATTNYNGNLQIRTYRNYDAADNLEWSTDARGFTTDYVYDDLYRRTQVVHPANLSGTRPVETFEYDLFGNVDRYFDAESNVWNYASTPAGNLFGVWHPNGLTHDVFTFDLQGGMTNSLIDASQLALNQTMEFDEFNRLLLVHKDRDTLEYDYDAFGQQTNRIAGGRSWETKFDALGRIEKQFRPSRSVEEYQYNELGYRTHFWNAESKPTTFGVDAKGRTTSVTNALNKVTRYSFDEAGNVEWRIKPDQEQTINQYDALNQLTNVLHEGVWKSSFSYDSNGNNVAQASPRASCTFGFDGMNRLASSTQSVDVVSFIVDNSYNLNGSRTGIAYPGGLVVDYEYDEENRVKFITVSGGGLSVPFTVEHGYDGASRLRSITYPNGINSSFGYDA
ncbi:MAG: SBBP repeat-containing protein, partial [Pontiellaceae bacterium]|nr:SBBP repeat-containing protein [Pontiellaceae bacterium]